MPGIAIIVRSGNMKSKRPHPADRYLALAFAECWPTIFSTVSIPGIQGFDSIDREFAGEPEFGRFAIGNTCIYH